MSPHASVLKEAVLELIMRQRAGVGMAVNTPKSATLQSWREPQAAGVVQV